MMLKPAIEIISKKKNIKTLRINQNIFHDLEILDEIIVRIDFYFQYEI